MNAVLSGTPAWLTTRSTGCKAAEPLSNVMIDSFGSLRCLLGLLLGILEAGRRNNGYSLEECMNRLTTMQVLVQVVETGSVSGAARQLAITPRRVIRLPLPSIYSLTFIAVIRPGRCNRS